MIVSLVLGIIICMILGFSAIDKIGRNSHYDSRKRSYYEISHRKDKKY